MADKTIARKWQGGPTGVKLPAHIHWKFLIGPGARQGDYAFRSRQRFWMFISARSVPYVSVLVGRPMPRLHEDGRAGL
jgi:hypothetical protein